MLTVVTNNLPWHKCPGAKSYEKEYHNILLYKKNCLSFENVKGRVWRERRGSRVYLIDRNWYGTLVLDILFSLDAAVVLYVICIFP